MDVTKLSNEQLAIALQTSASVLSLPERSAVVLLLNEAANRLTPPEAGRRHCRGCPGPAEDLGNEVYKKTTS